MEPPGQLDQRDRLPPAISPGVLQFLLGHLDCECWGMCLNPTGIVFHINMSFT